MTVIKAPATIDLDVILGELGHFGKHQFFTYVFIVLPIVFSATYNGNYVFSAVDMTYRCHIPECDSEIPTLEAEWLNYTMPSSEDPRRCYRYPSLANVTHFKDTDICSPDMFDRSKTVRCENWVHNKQESIVVELGIQCESWKRTLVGTIHSFGLLFALPLVGFISDKYGRKIAFCMSAFLAGVFGLCRSFATSYIMFLTFEFIEPLLGSGVYSSGFILGMELVGPKRRVLGATILCMCYSFGAVVLGLVAWALPYWRTLLRVIYAPSLLFVFYFFIINESIRWLISQGRYEKAIDILKSAAKVNGVTLTDKSMESLYSNVEDKNNTDESDTKKEDDTVEEVPKAKIFKSKILLLRVLKCSFWWITCTLVYYGLSINAVSLGGHIYINFVFVSLVEMPAYLLGYFLLNRIGRKYTLCCAYTISGLACISFAFIPTDYAWLSLVIYLVGKFFITMAFGSLYIYTSELFPTCLRHSLLGTCSMIGRIGSIVAPQTPLLAEIMAGLPCLLFGSFSIISGLLMLTSPETLNIKLPDTIEEAENITKNSNKNENDKI